MKKAAKLSHRISSNVSEFERQMKALEDSRAPHRIKGQAEHFVEELRKRLAEIRVEARRLRRLIRSLTHVKDGEIVSALADAEMLRIVLPSPHSKPRSVCPHCNKNRALHRCGGWFYKHAPCGIVRTSDGKRYPFKGFTINPADIPDDAWI